jgi:hypothetical protein
MGKKMGLRTRHHGTFMLSGVTRIAAKWRVIQLIFMICEVE